MSCCSRQRQVITPALRAAPPVPVQPASTAVQPMLRYTGVISLTFRGPFSGAVYRMSTSRRSINVDPRDIDAMMRTGLFER